MDKRTLKHLIDRFKSQTITKEELHKLQAFAKENPGADDLLDELFEEYFHNLDIEGPSEASSKKMYDRIVQELNLGNNIEESKRKARALYWVATAAAILMVAGYFFLSPLLNQNQNPLLTSAKDENAILPGGARATVILDDGTTISLDSLAVDSTILLNGYAIVKDENGLLTYSLIDGQHKDQQVVYNTIVTPKGGEYKLNLPDGTRIWVNASSKVRYPLNFAKDSREVQLEGEAYFDVKHIREGERDLPFIVFTNGQKLEVLGTTFNINSYGEQVETTLVEGAVKLNFKGLAPRYLAPNEQSSYNEKENAVEVREVDPYYTTAWKNQKFAFDDASMYEVMETIARWYDVEVSYEGDFSESSFNGTISRYEGFENLLEIIELTGKVKFKVSGRRVVVMN